MKWFLAVTVALLAVSSTLADGPDDQYVLVYNLIQEGDVLNNNAQPRQALAKYLEAQKALEQFRKGYPDWNPKVVNFRLSYIAAKIAAVSASLPPEAQPIPSNAITSFSAAANLHPNQPAPPPDWENQVNNLNGQVRQLQTDKSVLEAKLKEALSAQPPAADPRELARAEAKIKSLLKENDLLKLTLDQQNTKPVPSANTQELDQTRRALAQANRDLAEQTRKAKELEQEKTALQVKLNNLPPASYNAGTIEATRKSLQAAERKADEQTKLAARLAEEKAALQGRLKSLSADADAAAALRAENEILKKQLASLKSLPAPDAKVDDVRRQLALARTQVANLESDRDMLRLEKQGLEQRIKQMTATAARSSQAEQISRLQQERDDLRKQLDAARFELNGRKGEVAMAKVVATDRQAALVRDAETISKLQQERDDLRKQLDAANKELASRKGKVSTARAVEMESQVASLRARLEVFEARKVPYTAEELALFRKPEPKLPQPLPKPKEMSAASVALVADAQRYFSAKQYEKAEEKYVQVIHQDQPTASTLANLAAVELELNHLDQAETSIKQSLALTPNDPNALTVLGRLKFKEGKYDDAFDALSRAAKADPQNAEVQNFLGLVLSQKGLRGPAEAALRKAIQLEPSYGEAHNNLAVIYITQQPPLVELARWHYQKALDSGAAHNPNLEKMFETAKTADSSH